MSAAIDYRLKIEAALEHAFEYLALINPAMASLVRTVPHYASSNSQHAAFATRRACYYGPKFAAFQPLQRIGTIIHEWSHVALGHVDRMATIESISGAIAPEIHNIATDLMINTWIQEIVRKFPNTVALPDNVVTIESLSREIPDFGLHINASRLAQRHGVSTIAQLAEYDADTIYLILFDVLKAAGRIISIDFGGSLRGDQVADIDPAPANVVADVPPAVANIAHVIGALAGADSWNFASNIMAHLPTAKIDWLRRLREIALTALSDESVSTWNRPSRRFYSAPPGIAFMPGLQKAPAAKAVAIIDTSSSVDDPTIDQFTSEIRRVASVSNQTVTVIEADTEVKKVSTIGPHAPPYMTRKDHGRGGTQFDAALKVAAAMKPDVIIYLTDLVAAPPTFRPKCATIWCAVGNAPDMPFGRHIRIPANACS